MLGYEAREATLYSTYRRRISVVRMSHKIIPLFIYLFLDMPFPFSIKSRLVGGFQLRLSSSALRVGELVLFYFLGGGEGRVWEGE